MIYYIQSKETGLIKIGTSERVKSRMKQISKQHKSDMCICALSEGGRSEEQDIHSVFGMHRAHGEWFYPHPDLMLHIENVGMREIPKDKVGVYTVRVDDEFKARLEAEAKRRGIGWTTTLAMLAREALAQKEMVK